MNGRIGSSGIVVSLFPHDSDTLRNGGTLEGRFVDHRNPTVKLHVLDTVEKTEEDFQCEPGFRIAYHPPDSEPKNRTNYEIWITKEHAKTLLKEKYYVSRSQMDRVDMIYER